MKENIIWKRMIYHGKDLGDYYLVSNTGEIKGVKTRKIRKKNINHEGYYYVCVSLGSRENKLYIKVHRAVAETFLDNSNDNPVINHKDGNKLNNNVNNLEWCTHSYNTQHAIENNLISYDTLKNKVQSIDEKFIFDSITDAGRYFEPNNPENGRKNISRAISVNGTAYGYKWCYVDNYKIL